MSGVTLLYESPVTTHRVEADDDRPLQRSHGVARVGFGTEAGQTVLKTLRQSGSAKVRFPALAHGRAEAVLINTSGGLTGGDRFEVEARLETGSTATLTTQACERVYRSPDATAAEVQMNLAVESGARLNWLPQETIAFDGGRLDRHLQIGLAADATFLGVESFLLGRSAMGETVRTGSLKDRWTVRREGALAFTDILKLDGAIDEIVRRPAVLDGRRAFSTILFFGRDPDRYLAPLRETLGDDGGASVLDDRLVARLAASDGLTLRRRLLPALSILTDGQPLPRVWQL